MHRCQISGWFGEREAASVVDTKVVDGLITPTSVEDSWCVHTESWKGTKH